MSRHGWKVGTFILVCFAFILVGISVAVVPNGALAVAQDIPDWREFWEVQPGFDISIDSEGFEFPSSIAFVPNPGTLPKDPLYFVTELRGRVKVITNDRSVLTFAEVSYDLRPNSELPAIAGDRARDLWGPSLRAADAIVVGDTPSDVACGKAGGMRTLAVATGSFSLGDLEVTGPDHILEDLCSTTGVVTLLIE